MANSLYGPLKVTNSQLTDLNGSPVILSGVSTHGLAWYPDFINDKAFDQLRDMGVSCIRLAMYTEEHSGYCSDGDKDYLLSLIDLGIRLAAERGMYVIVDWHTLSDNDPNKHKAEAKDFFTYIADKYQGYDNIIYEICNEPNRGCTWDDIYDYANEIIPIIRKYSDNIILVGTPFWSQQCLDPLERLLPYDNIMYTLHFYAATHGDFLIERMETALKSNLPMFVSEFSICESSGSGRIDYECMNKWLALLNKYSISRIIWCLSNSSEMCSLLTETAATGPWKPEDFKAHGGWLLKNCLNQADF